jgi:hypothetical protein
MNWFLILRGKHWKKIDSEYFKDSAEMPDCCQVVCDTVEIGYPFVTIKAESHNTVIIPASDVVFMAEFNDAHPIGFTPNKPA